MFQSKIKNKKKVVIVGGGFAGINVAKNLLRWAPGKFSISIIDKKDYHLFTPALFKAAASLLPPSKIFAAVAFRFADIFSNSKDVEVFTKEIKNVDFEKGMVAFKGDKVLPYDFLILAPGLETDFKNIPGAKDHALPLKTYEDAIGIKSRLEEVVKNKAKKDDICVLVAGAGLTGIEVAGELVGYLKNLSEMYGHPKESIKTKLIDGGNKIASTGHGGWMGGESEKKLKELGIGIVLNKKIKEIKRDIAVFENGGVEKCDVLIWAAGVSQGDFIKKLEVASGPTLRFGRYKNIFVLGDVSCGAVLGGTRGCTAQSAIHQAGYAPRAILGGNKSKYKASSPRFINAIGKDFALADLGFIKFKGRLAYFAKNFAYLNYFTRILPWRKAFEVYRRYKSL